MANPFVGIAQIGVNDFWSLLQQLQAGGNKIKADLSTDRLQLMNAYTAARNDSDAARGAAAMNALIPLIHQNSTLRLQYQGLAQKFTDTVNAASSWLRQAGLSTPTLSGMGDVTILVVGTALLLAAAAWGIYEALAVATSSQRQATQALVKLLNDPTTTPEQKAAAAKALAKGAGTPPPGDPFGIGNLVMPLALIAAIILVPKILPRRSAA